MRFVLAMTLMTALTGACGASATSITMKGKDPDIALLAGDWTGEYRGLDSGRTGPIHFALEVGRHTADGEVSLDEGKTALKVSFVQVQRGSVSGKMAPYTDPQCSCEVQTEFLGTVEGNTIEGTYVTSIPGTGRTQKGAWTVTRQAE
jgi:hypothetical protein